MLKRLLPLLFIPSLCGAGTLQTQKFFKNDGGLSNHVSPLLIPDNSAADIQNITMDDRGLLSKRNGYSVIQSSAAMIGFSTWTVNGGTFHKATSGSDFFAVVVGTAVYRISTSFQTYSSVTGSVAITATTSNLAQATHLQDFAIFCNEVDKPFYVGSTGNALAISTNTFSTAKTCSTYGYYLVMGNTTESSTSYPNRIRWSDPNNINSFPSLNYIDVEADDGDKIVGTVAFDDSVYIFKKKSIYKMQITGLDGADAFIIRPISRNIGAWSKNSIKAIPNVGVMFLAQNTAYLLNDDGLTPVGDSIQRSFDNISRSMWPNAVAEVYPKRYQYWLAVSTSGSTNTEVLIYDYIQKNWTVYAGMNVNMLAQSEDSSGQNILVSGDYQATTYKQDTGSTDNPRGVSTAISAFYTTANLAFNYPDIRKGFKYLYIYSVGDQNYTLTVDEGYDLVSTYEHTDSIAFGSTSSVYDTGVYDTASFPASGYGITRIELNRSAKYIRLRFSNSASGELFGLVGWTIVYSPEDFAQ